MQLHPCQPPSGSLEAAPRSSLRADSEHGRWEGFWCDDERYYTRCTRPDGSEQWYRIEEPRGVLSFRARGLRFARATALTHHAGARASTIRSGYAMLVSTRPGGRSMLVGTWRRARRAGDAG